MSVFSNLCAALLAHKRGATIDDDALGYLIDEAHDEHSSNYQWLHEAQQEGVATDEHVALFNAQGHALAAVDSLIDKWVPR